MDKPEPRSGAVERATFVLRLWRPSTDRGAWQGDVEHVQSGERRAVPGVADALRAVRAWLRGKR